MAVVAWAKEKMMAMKAAEMRAAQAMTATSDACTPATDAAVRICDRFVTDLITSVAIL